MSYLRTRGAVVGLVTLACAWVLAAGATAAPRHAHRHNATRHNAAAGRHYTVTSTAYDACSSGTITASGAHTYWGEVANNFLPLGTRIRLDHPVDGRRYFRVMDRIGWGTQLDIWMPGCSAAIAYGRRTIGFRVIRQ